MLGGQYINQKNNLTKIVPNKGVIITIMLQVNTKKLKQLIFYNDIL